MTPERFWGRIDRSGGEDACWPWHGATDGRGYGQIMDRPTKRRSHRLAYELTVGPIPAGLDLLHTCDNPPCCNPRHLRPGTASDNVQDAVAKGRWPSLRRDRPEVLTEASRRHARGHSFRRIARELGVNRATLARYIRRDDRAPLKPPVAAA